MTYNVERGAPVTGMERYLKCTEFIDWDAESVKRKADALTKRLQTDREKAVALYYFVRDEIKHNAYAPLYDPERYKASAILEAGNGFCQQKAILLVALARAVGIPARLGFVDMLDHRLSRSFREMIGGVNRLPFHGYAELFIGGKWIHASPAYDLDICRKKRFAPVEFDGVNDAKDSPYDIDGNPHIEHIKDHGPYQDFPWDEVLNYYRVWVAQLGLDWDQFSDVSERIRQSKAKD
jgi:transglutaminase-like putative cysteine protease